MEPAAGGARGAARSSPPSGCRSEATAPPPPAAHACPQSRGWGAAGGGSFLSRCLPPAPVTAPGPRQERAGVPSALGHFRRAGPHRAVLPAGNAFGADTNPDGDSCPDVIKSSKGFQRPHYGFPPLFPHPPPPPSDYLVLRDSRVSLLFLILVLPKKVVTC